MGHTVAVIILMYNDLPHAHRAIESVVQQTYTNLDIYILDNGSTDNTWVEIQKYQTDSRVHLVRNSKNQRSEFPTRIALEINTPYLSFLFADDVYELDRIEQAVALIEKDPENDYVFFNNHFVNEFGKTVVDVPPSLFNGDISRYNRFRHLEHMFFIGNSLHPCAMLIKTETYKNLGGFKGYLHRIGDMVFFARLLIGHKGVFSSLIKQRISIWTNGRNESTSNIGFSEILVFERTQFLAQFVTPAALSILDQIFNMAPLQKEIGLSSDVERIWFLAHKAIYPGAAIDFKIFGFSLLYRVLEMHDAEFESKILRLTGCTMSEYILNLQAWAAPSSSQQNTPISLPAAMNLLKAVSEKLAQEKAAQEKQSQQATEVHPVAISAGSA